MERFYLRALHVHAPTHTARRFVTGRASMGFLSLGAIDEARPVTARTARAYLRAWDASGQGKAYAPNGADAVPLRMLPFFSVCESCGAIDGEHGCPDCGYRIAGAPRVPYSHASATREPWSDADVQAAKRERAARGSQRAAAYDAHAWHALRAEGIDVHRAARVVVRAWRTHGARTFEALREGYLHAAALERAAQRGDAHALPEHVQAWAIDCAIDRYDGDGVAVEAGPVTRALDGGYWVPARVHVDAPHWYEHGMDTNEGER